MMILAEAHILTLTT